MRESFILYTSFYEPIKTLSEKQLGKLFKAIFNYQIDCNTQVDSDIQMAFAFIKNQFDIDERKYQEKIRKNAENGKRGGRPPKKDTQDEKASGNLESEKSERFLKKPKKADNDNVDEDVNEDEEISISNEIPCEGNPHAAEPIDYAKLVSFFNSETKGIFGEVRLPISDKRKTLIRARINEHGKEHFAEVIKKAAASDFLRGQNKNSFTATFDWIIKPTNFEKILSGNYGNKENQRVNSNGSRPTMDELEAAVEAGLALAAASKNK